MLKGPIEQASDWLRYILSDSHRVSLSCLPDYQEPLHNEILSGEHLHGEGIFCAHYEKSVLIHFPLSCSSKVPDQLVKFLVTSHVDTNLKPSYGDLSKQPNILFNALLIGVISLHRGLAEPP